MKMSEKIKKRIVKRKMAKRQPIYMSKGNYIFLNHIFTSFSSGGQKVLQTCPSLKILLPRYNCVTILDNLGKIHGMIWKRCQQLMPSNGSREIVAVFALFWVKLFGGEYAWWVEKSTFPCLRMIYPSSTAMLVLSSAWSVCLPSITFLLKVNPTYRIE